MKRITKGEAFSFGDWCSFEERSYFGKLLLRGLVLLWHLVLLLGLVFLWYLVLLWGGGI